MSLSTSFQPVVDWSTLIPTVLESRHQYCFCHVRVPGEEQRLPAITVHGKFYSLFKVVKVHQKALELCHLLQLRHQEAIITRLVKGDAIWVWERDAIADLRTQQRLQAIQPRPSDALCPILELSHQYQPCYIRVPDTNEPLEAIELEGRYYGLFRLAKSQEKALELVKKLKQRGDEPIITRTSQGDAVWVLESDACLA